MISFRLFSLKFNHKTEIIKNPIMYTLIYLYDSILITFSINNYLSYVSHVYDFVVIKNN